MLLHALLQLLISVGLVVQIVTTSSDNQCAQPECRINPNKPCEVITHKYETESCPSSLHSILPRGGYRDLPGTPTDLKVERKEDTGEPIIDITWKPPIRGLTSPDLSNFTLFIEVWDIKDRFKRKCHDRWYTIKTEYGSVWPEQKSITVRLSCQFFFDKWLFVFVNSEFDGASPCFLRQARFNYRSSEAPHGLPDYKVKMYPHGKDDILIRSEPDPNVEHFLLWCDGVQSPKCKLTPDNECQKTTLRKICPQGEDSITQTFQVFIPDMKFSTYQKPPDNKQVHVVDLSNGEKSSSVQPPTTTQSKSSESHTHIIWIVVGCLILSSLVVLFLVYRRFASGGNIKCPCKEIKRKFLIHFETFTSSDTCDKNMGRSIEDETCVVGSIDTPIVPIFYYPDNNSHSDKVNWWVTRIEKRVQSCFNVKVVSVIDESFQEILSNDDLDIFGVLFIVNSRGLHQFLPCLKFKNKSSPKKQTVVRYLKERHNKVFILELYDEEKSDISDIQTLLDLDNIIQLNDGKADDSINHILDLLKDQDLGNQTFSKKLDVHQTSLDGGYYSGDKFPQPIKTFFPPELVSADSEGSINDRLAAINQRCSKHYCEDGGYEVDYLGATFTVHQAADSLSV